MKKLLLLLSLTISLMADFNYNNIQGQWEFSSIRDNLSVSFGAEFARDGFLVVEFDRRGMATVKTTGNQYFYKIENGNLLISESRPDRKGNLRRVDVISMDGENRGCSTVKFLKKGIAGVSNKRSFRACKMRPEPIYTRPYGYDDGYEYRR